MKLLRLIICLTLVFMFTVSSVIVAQELKTIQLPPQQKNIGMPLMQALKERKSGREFSSQKLSSQTLSNLLWAAWGINRSDGHRTAPSAINLQDIDVYVAASDGLFLYDAKNHQLQKILSEDIRADTGNQDYVKNAALNLIYVSDLARLKVPDPMAVEFFTGAHTAFIAQNVYLFCASEGLSTVVRGNINKEALAIKMKLREDQKITLAQSVGYPVEQ